MDFSPFDGLQTPIWVFDIQRLRMVWANRTAVSIWQASSLDELVSRDFSPLFGDAAQSRQPRLRVDLQAFEQGRTIQATWIVYPTDQPVLMACLCSGITLEDGRRAMLVEAQLELGHRLEQLSKNIPGAIFQYRRRLDASSQIPYASQGLWERYGLSPEALRQDATSACELVHPEDVAWLQGTLEQSAKTLTEWQCDFRILHAGETRWISTHATPERELDGSTLWHGYLTDVTDRKLAESILRGSEATKQAMLEAIPDLLLRMNRQGDCLNMISGGEIRLWKPVKPNGPQPLYEILPPVVLEQRLHYIRKALDTGDRQIYQQDLDVDGDLLYEEVRIVPINPDEVLVMVRNITDRVLAEQEVRQQAEMLQVIFDHIPIMVALLDAQGRLQFVNKAMEKILGWTLEDWQQHDILAECYPDLHYRQQIKDHVFTANGQWQDLKSRTALGDLIDTSWSNIRLSDSRIIAIGQDITERKQWEDHLQHLATHDKLTTLPNRYQFDEYLGQEWKRLAREQKPLALILCDIDEFKAYNDTLGHLAGDSCLMQVARAIAGVVRRPADLAARYGGEEFALVLPDTDLAGATWVAETLRQAVVRLGIPHPRAKVAPHLTLSLGIACVYPCLQLVPDQLTAMADNALYRAKARGRNRYCIAE